MDFKSFCHFLDQDRDDSMGNRNKGCYDVLRIISAIEPELYVVNDDYKGTAGWRKARGLGREGGREGGRLDIDNQWVLSQQRQQIKAPRSIGEGGRERHRDVPAYSVGLKEGPEPS